VSDIDTTVADSLKALDLNGRLEKLPSPTSFDHLVGGHLWGLWHPQAERLDGLEIEPREEEAPRVSGPISKQHGGYCCEWQNPLRPKKTIKNIQSLISKRRIVRRPAVLDRSYGIAGRIFSVCPLPDINFGAGRGAAAQ